MRIDRRPHRRRRNVPGPLPREGVFFLALSGERGTIIHPLRWTRFRFPKLREVLEG